jgi:hypothetical protein
MQDFIGETRANQRNAARKLVQRLSKTLSPVLDQQLRVAIAQAQGAGRELDLELARDILNSELERDLYMALVGYTDWLASRVWREHGLRRPGEARRPPPATQRLPVCDEEAQARIREAYHVDAGPVNLVLDAVELGLELPPIGQVDDRRVLHMNWDNISRWADLYEWTSPSR